MKQKLLSLAFIAVGVVLTLLLFDRGWLALLGPIIFVLSVFLSFLMTKQEYGWLTAMIAPVLWFLAIIINRISVSYKYYSEYDFIDPIEGFILSVLLALIAFCVTTYDLFIRNIHNSKS